MLFLAHFVSDRDVKGSVHKRVQFSSKAQAPLAGANNGPPTAARTNVRRLPPLKKSARLRNVTFRHINLVVPFDFLVGPLRERNPIGSMRQTSAAPYFELMSPSGHYRSNLGGCARTECGAKRHVAFEPRNSRPLRCPHCGRVMEPARVQPGLGVLADRIFRCDKCGHVEMVKSKDK